MKKNKFNNLTSKQWLPFQKSWFRYKDKLELYKENIFFFTKSTREKKAQVLYFGKDPAFDRLKRDRKINVKTFIEHEHFDTVDFIIFDLLDYFSNDLSGYERYLKMKSELRDALKTVYPKLTERRFVCVFVKNIEYKNKFIPIVWDLAKYISQILSLKDEKIGCVDDGHFTNQIDGYFATDQSVFYSLYFRKDERNKKQFDLPAHPNTDSKFRYKTTEQQLHSNEMRESYPQWLIIKPPPRKKDEILHPAKFPETLIERFIQHFTKKYESVLDPMCGTGSAQIAALRKLRNAYGMELSEYFYNIALKRCGECVIPDQTEIFQTNESIRYFILNKDARTIQASDFPLIDYIITSPPYWDMLNMKGAEYQARRKSKGLQLNYSEREEDLGNVKDYNKFLDELSSILDKAIELLKPGGYVTIIVKNIKKSGRNYPLAWDLAERLSKKLILLPEVFWCQDDITIVPYGYGNTWVSNIFHQYCLNFQKPPAE